MKAIVYSVAETAKIIGISTGYMIPTQQSMESLEVMLTNVHFLMPLLIVCCVHWKT